MSFLRRLLGGEHESPTPEETSTNGNGAPAVDADEAERLHERELVRSENERLDDLRRRQLKYADRAWTPPAQGGDRRADDEDPGSERS